MGASVNDTLLFALILSGTFWVAGVVKGITGMGLPTVAMGLLGLIMPPVAAATLLILPSFVTNVWQLFSGPAISRLFRRFGLMMAGTAVGTLLSSPLLIYIKPEWSGMVLGIALVAYAGYALISPGLKISQHHESWMSPITGAITGIITGATGVFVIPSVPYLSSLKLNKEELIQVLGLSFTVSTLSLATGLFTHHAIDVDKLSWSGWVIVPAIVGMWAGQKLRARISPKRFKQYFLLFLMVPGAELILRPFF